MRALGFVLALCLSLLAGRTHALTNDWVDWQAPRDGAQHTYALHGLTLKVSSKPTTPASDGRTPMLTVSARGAPPITLTGVDGEGDPAALIGVVQLDPAAAKPQVLFLTFSGGAHCCTTMTLAAFAAGRWRTFQITYDGPPDKAVIYAKAGAPPVLAIGDENFDYAFASHAGSYMVGRYYAVRGGRLYDVSGEARFAAVRHAAEAETLGYCRQEEDAETGSENGACAAYVAEAALAGDHAAAWVKVQGLYRRQNPILPNGCRIFAGPNGCPKPDVITFKTFPAALTWFLWRYGYYPTAPTFPCAPTNCDVPMPRTPPPRN